MPPLEEGNLWIRATLPQDISFDAAASDCRRTAGQIAKSPEVTQAVSQMGRPDDGTDVVTFNDVEVSVALKPPSEWRPGLTKNELIDEMNPSSLAHPRHGPELLPEYSGQRRRSHVRRQGRKLAQAVWRRL